MCTNTSFEPSSGLNEPVTLGRVEPLYGSTGLHVDSVGWYLGWVSEEIELARPNPASRQSGKGTVRPAGTAGGVFGWIEAGRAVGVVPLRAGGCAGARKARCPSRGAMLCPSTGGSQASRTWTTRGCTDLFASGTRATVAGWRPQGESNPRRRRERAVSWASRRWGRIPVRRPGAVPFGTGRRRYGGARRDRTADLYNAIVALSQLSYGPRKARILGSGRLPVKAEDCQGGRPVGEGASATARSGFTARRDHGMPSEVPARGPGRRRLRPPAPG